MRPFGRRKKVIGLLLAPIGLLAGFLIIQIAVGLLIYPPEYVLRVLAYGQSDALDWQKFPSHPLSPASSPHPFPRAADPFSEADLAAMAGAPDWQALMERSHTQAFIVVRDGQLAYEGYFNGSDRGSLVTSFSVAKSFASSLVGIAIEQGAIGSVDDPITAYLPELSARDPRFDSITIQDLLRMASGLAYQELRFPGLNSDDPLTTYFPDQRWLALNNTNISEAPGQHFSYNKYHPQLLGMILERSTGLTVTEFMQLHLWNPLGMEYAGSWSTDSAESDFEKMETGVNARAIDFAKFGQLYLQAGTWDGRQIVPAEWVAASTEPWSPLDPVEYYQGAFGEQAELGYYGYMWWGFYQPDGYAFMAAGDRGQYIYVDPASQTVIVRNGTDFGLSGAEWRELFEKIATTTEG
jgi:CubicO group peptidase (beta-lactamase class C family)